MAVLTQEPAAAVEIDSAELAQRVAVLRRFKKLLTQQRDRFRNYLDLLDKQQGVIESGSAEDLLRYVEIEEKVVADIFSIQKVIDPLEEMYYTIVTNKDPAGFRKDVNINDPADSHEEVTGLKASLERLQSEAVMRSTKNKELLSKRMIELRSEIKNLRNNPYNTSSRSYSNSVKATIVDIHG